MPHLCLYLCPISAFLYKFNEGNVRAGLEDNACYHCILYFYNYADYLFHYIVTYSYPVYASRQLSHLNMTYCVLKGSNTKDQFWEIIYLYKGLFNKSMYFICQTILLPMHCTVLPIKVGNVVTLKTCMQENFI